MLKNRYLDDAIIINAMNVDYVNSMNLDDDDV